MKRLVWLAVVLGCGWMTIVHDVSVQAQEAPEPDVPPPSSEPSDEETAEPELTPEEEKALMESLGADAETIQEQKGSAQTVITGGTQSANPDIAFILDVAGAWFSTDEPLQVGSHDPNKTGFVLQQLEMSIGSNVDPFFRFDSYLVFAQFGVEVEEAYVTTLALPTNFQVRAGQFLTRFGRLNSTHPHAWQFADQPLVNGKFFGGEGSRGLGLELSWLSPLPWYAELVGSAGDAAGECCARSFYGGNDLGVEGVEDVLYTTALKQFFDLGENWGLMWGMSAQFGPNPSGQGNRTEIYGTDLYLRFRPVQSTNRTAVSLQIEAMMRNRQAPDDVLKDFGGYGQLVWNITPRWEIGGRYELVTGVEEDPLDPDWSEDRARYSVQGTYYPSHFARLRLQGSYDDPEWLSEPIWASFLALEILVGAHGAHTY